MSLSSSRTRKSINHKAGAVEVKIASDELPKDRRRTVPRVKGKKKPRHKPGEAGKSRRFAARSRVHCALVGSFRQARLEGLPQSSRAVEWNYTHEALIGVEHLHLPSMPIVSCLIGLLQQIAHDLCRFTSSTMLVNKIQPVAIFR